MTYAEEKAQILKAWRKFEQLQTDNETSIAPPHLKRIRKMFIEYCKESGRTIPENNSEFIYFLEGFAIGVNTLQAILKFADNEP